MEFTPLPLSTYKIKRGVLFLHVRVNMGCVIALVKMKSLGRTLVEVWE